VKKSRPVIQFTSAFLAFLLLFLATAGQSFSHKKEIKKTQKEQTKGKATSDERPTVQELSTDVVVTPSLSFDFVQDFYLLPRVFIVEYLGATLIKQFDIFYYFFSFFRNVFGHYIAINAP
jgi:hypothetical protein